MFGANLNSIDAALSREGAWEAYYGDKEMVKRLRTIKGKLDPQEVFRIRMPLQKDNKKRNASFCNSLSHGFRIKGIVTHTTHTLSIYHNRIIFCDSGKTMSNITTEILLHILTELKRMTVSNNDLLSCLRVCRRWHEPTLSVLYGSLTLTNLNRFGFLESSQVINHGSYVRSITVRIVRGGTGGSQSSQTSNDLLDRLILWLPSLNKLRCLSLTVDQYVFVPTDSTIDRLLKALPETCVDLELDTSGSGHEDSPQANAHSCDTVRHILPRLRHVRIRMPEMCSAMFGTGPILTGGLQSTTFEPLVLRNLQTLIVNCTHASGKQIVRCRELEREMAMISPFPIQPDDADSAWLSVTQALEQVSNRGHLRQNAKIYVIAGTPGSVHDMAIWQTELRTNMVAKETWAFPIRVAQNQWHIRLHDKRDLVTSLDNVKSIVEGHLWRNIMGRALFSRLPASVIMAEAKGDSSYASGCMELPMKTMTLAQWATSPLRLPSYARNEQVTGVRLFEAQIRKGEDYLSARPIVEITPDGWVRGWANVNLERVEEDGVL
ncbi:hypothetical protein GQ43DRAFT_463805 [Delitschia confertaspora ATCC 74209]|uniref:F-box domain-containing protein n=1 Tax=Delitschia confertaspora ATCC 74209 TaxID=1513339 RepID=A0A9P4JLY4_9PLEO|nr:hypothetical protein GQ43DRAFT_463805 [Delitschia confertaspora ATCC 74209]